MADVDTLILDARNYASDAVNEASSAISRAIAYADRSFNINVPNLDYTNEGSPSSRSLGVIDPSVGELTGLTGELAVNPVTRESSPVFTPPIQPPEFGASSPRLREVNPAPDVDFRSLTRQAVDLGKIDQLFRQQHPAFNVDGFAKSPPEFDQSILTFPDAPEPLGGDVEPDLGNYTVPTVPDLPPMPRFEPDVDPQSPSTASVQNLKTEFKNNFNQLRPELQAFIDSAASAWIQTYAPDYYAAQARLQGIVEDNLTGRTTAIPDDIEQRIFQRGRERADGESVGAAQAELDQAAKRGWFVPGGSMQAILSRSTQQAANRGALVAAETAIERARLEQQNMQFMAQLSSTIQDSSRAAVLQYLGIIGNANEQALRHSQGVVDALIATFNALRDKYIAEVEELKVEADIFETRLRSALVDLEKFRAEAEAVRLLQETDEQKIRVAEFKIRLKEQEISVYESLLRSIQSKVDAERFKFDVFESEVTAYRAFVTGKESEFRGYEAAVRGDEAVLRGELSKLEIANQDLQAKELQLRAYQSELDGIRAYNEDQVRRYDTELQRFDRLLESAKFQFAQYDTTYRNELERYVANVRMDIAELGAEIDRERFQLQASVTEHESQVRAELARVEAEVTSMRAKSDAASEGARVYGSWVGSMLSAQNTLVALLEEESD